MPALTYGDRPTPPPDLMAVAREVHAALILEQAFGTVPEYVEFRVVALDGAKLVVALGGLSNEFLLGPEHRDPVEDVDVITPDEMVTAAQVLYRAVERLVVTVSPHRAPGEPWFPTVIWLQFEHQAASAATAFPAGVVQVVNGSVL
ncbi:hypothetical protein [Actinokineospora sp.]|uniref:hypothetical protein n=1 Tax=Actinokineospora sp. TaxID=1872133 RepID=UPI003D6A9248